MHYVMSECDPHIRTVVPCGCMCDILYDEKWSGCGDQLWRLLFVDTETTGLDLDNDRAWEFGAVMVDVDIVFGHVVAIVDRIQQLEDPSVPISPEVADLCRVDPASLSGKKFDRKVIRDAIDRADIVIAHNAIFDWRMTRYILGADMPDTMWIDSRRLGIPGHESSNKQELLALMNGFLYADKHRALDDAAALALLVCWPRSDGLEVPAVRIDDEASTDEVLCGVRIPFDCKDALKANGGWNWDALSKIWWKSTRGTTFDAVRQEAERCGSYSTLQCVIAPDEKFLIGSNFLRLRWSSDTTSSATIRGARHA